MAESSLMLEGEEISFFGDRSFNGGEKTKTQKDLTKNSSNPEKIYESLNSEIKKVTEQKLLDLSSSNKTIDQPPNEPMFSDNIWNNNNTKANAQQDTLQYYKKFELLKRQFHQKEEKKNKSKIKIPHPTTKVKKTINAINNNNKTQIIQQDTFDDDVIPNDEFEEEGGLINKINSIDIKSNIISHKKEDSINSNTSSGLNYSTSRRQICMTEPDELFYTHTPYFSDSLQITQSNNTPQQIRTFTPPYLLFQQQLQKNLMNQFTSPTNTVPNLSHRCLNNQGSFISTQYSSNKMYMSNDLMDEGEDTDINENVEGSSGSININYNNPYIRDYRARIPTNESNESNKSLRYQTRQSWNDINEKKMYSASFNESNFYTPYTANGVNLKGFLTKTNALSKTKGKSDLFNQNKNEKQLINLEEIAIGADNRTTLMIRNIPIKYTDEMLINEVKRFENKFDCLYMPYDFEKGGNKGYAFINFTHPLNILLFYTLFEGKTWTYFESKKICELNFANFQGINEIKKHARNYKGLKKPTFFIITDDLKTNIEVPEKYLKYILDKYPKMSYIEKKQSQTILIKTLT